MTDLWSEHPLSFLTACATLLAILWGVRKTIADIALTRATTTGATYANDREVRDDDREQATRENEAAASLVEALTAGWNVIAEQRNVIAQQQSTTIAAHEARIAKLEKHLETIHGIHDREVAELKDRHEAEVEALENKIREYREKLHAANNELAKHGLVKHLVEAGVFPVVDDDGMAQERRRGVQAVTVLPIDPDGAGDVLA